MFELIFQAGTGLNDEEWKQMTHKLEPYMVNYDPKNALYPWIRDFSCIVIPISCVVITHEAAC